MRSLSLVFIWLLLTGCAAGGTAVPAPTDTAVLPTPSSTPLPPATTPAAGPITAANAGTLQSDDPLNVPRPYKMLWSADGQTMLLGNDDGLHTIASDGRGEIALTNTQTLSGTLDFARDGTLIALQDASAIRVYAPDSLELRQTIPFSGTATSAQISPDGRQLAVTSADNIAVTLYDLSTGQPAATLTGFNTAAPVYGVRFDADWQTAIWVARATVQLMDVTSGEWGPRFEHEDFVGALALSPDGRILATAVSATIDGQFTPIVKLWNAQTGGEIGVLPQPAIVSSLAFSPDGSLLAAGNIEGNILFWDVPQQAQVAALNDHVEQVRQLSFSPDGRILAAADGELRLWHAP